MTRAIGAGVRRWEGQRDRKSAMERSRMICSTVGARSGWKWEVMETMGSRRRVEEKDVRDGTKMSVFRALYGHQRG